MSRYVILTSDENLEVFVGFDEGMEGFFLTIADARICTGETGSYLFHNMDHHPGTRMTIEEVMATLTRFGLALPSDLVQQLASEGNCLCTVTPDKSNSGSIHGELAKTMPILGWQNAG